jgi:hypothetical protein
MGTRPTLMAKGFMGSSCQPANPWQAGGDVPLEANHEALSCLSRCLSKDQEGQHQRSQ